MFASGCPPRGGMGDCVCPLPIARPSVPKVQFPFITQYLNYIMFELLKNSLRAVAERYSEGECEDFPVRAIVCGDEATVVIRISDCGGGIPLSDLNRAPRGRDGAGIGLGVAVSDQRGASDKRGTPSLSLRIDRSSTHHFVLSCSCYSLLIPAFSSSTCLFYLSSSYYHYSSSSRECHGASRVLLVFFCVWVWSRQVSRLDAQVSLPSVSGRFLCFPCEMRSPALELGEHRSRRHGATRPTALCHFRNLSAPAFRTSNLCFGRIPRCEFAGPTRPRGGHHRCRRSLVRPLNVRLSFRFLLGVAWSLVQKLGGRCVASVSSAWRALGVLAHARAGACASHFAP